MPPGLSEPTAQPYLFYDLDCGFCRWTLAQILAWDRQGILRPAAIQDPIAERLLAALPAEARLQSWHLVAVDGTVFSGGEAFAPLFALLPRGAKLSKLAGAAPAATDSIYRFVARNRGLFGRAIGAGMRKRAAARIRARSDRSSLIFGSAEQ